MSRKAEAKEAKTKWPSGEVRMYPVGISESTRVTMTAFADSKHCAFAVGQRARDAKRERRKCGACLLQEELVLGLEPAPERLLEAERVHHESRVAGQAAQTGKTHTCDQHEHETRKHAATGGTYKGRSSARNLSAGSGTFVSGTHRSCSHEPPHLSCPSPGGSGPSTRQSTASAACRSPESPHGSRGSTRAQSVSAGAGAGTGQMH